VNAINWRRFLRPGSTSPGSQRTKADPPKRELSAPVSPVAEVPTDCPPSTHSGRSVSFSPEPTYGALVVDLTPALLDRETTPEEPQLKHELPVGIPISKLRPTQMTVGFREVERKRREWDDSGNKERAQLLRSHVVPVVIGPKGHHYLIDHHHFARALREAGATSVPVNVVADLSQLAKDEFWVFLDNRDWCHAYDGDGRRCDLEQIPKHLDDLADDPFRSLVAELIRAGGCPKSDTPFFEFLWADFLRRRIARKLVEKDFDHALSEALDLATSAEAKGLPGWVGKHD
jgi:hypothetical protein